MIIVLICPLISFSQDIGEIDLGPVYSKDFGNSELNKVKEFLLEKNYIEAKRQLQIFKNQELNASSEDIKNAYYELSYLVAKNELTNSKTPSLELKNNFYEKYELLSKYYTDAINNSISKKNKYAELLSSYENCVFSYTFYLQQENEYNRGLDALYHYQELKSKSEEILDEESRKFNNLASLNNIAKKIVTISRGYNTKYNSDESKNTLIKAYENYIERFPTDSSACVYMNLKMRLEGNIDLDVLTDMYKKCEDKDKQYHGNLLGLSNLLLIDTRAKDALYFLGQIDDDMIPAGRLCEKYFALARAYEFDNDIKNALKYYSLVLGMTDKFPEVKSRIQELTGEGDFDYLDIEELNLNTENTYLNSDDITTENVQDRQASSSEDITTELNSEHDSIINSQDTNSNSSGILGVQKGWFVGVLVLFIAIIAVGIFYIRKGSYSK